MRVCTRRRQRARTRGNNAINDSTDNDSTDNDSAEDNDHAVGSREARGASHDGCCEAGHASGEYDGTSDDRCCEARSTSHDCCCEAGGTPHGCCEAGRTTRGGEVGTDVGTWGRRTCASARSPDEASAGEGRIGIPDAAFASYAVAMLDARSLTGRLLVASPILLDPNFARTVVLVCRHDEDGAFGLVLNRPLAAPIGPHVRAWGLPLVSPDVVFAGGPVEPDVAFALGSGREIDAARWVMEPLPGVGLLSLDTLDDSPVVLERGRIFSGYAGWGARQLEGEILEEGWFVVDARPDDVFTADPARLWHDVLRRQPGELAMFASFPPDPGLN